VPGEEHLTPEERHVYSQLFKAADIDGKGIVLGDEAVEFFKKSSLPSHVLSEVYMVHMAVENDILIPLFINHNFD
jgi:epidermal growth factor receptor substrate 15